MIDKLHADYCAYFVLIGQLKIPIFPVPAVRIKLRELH